MSLWFAGWNSLSEEIIVGWDEGMGLKKARVRTETTLTVPLWQSTRFLFDWMVNLAENFINKDFLRKSKSNIKQHNDDFSYKQLFRNIKFGMQEIQGSNLFKKNSYQNLNETRTHFALYTQSYLNKLSGKVKKSRRKEKNFFSLFTSSFFFYFFRLSIISPP